MLLKCWYRHLNFSRSIKLSYMFLRVQLTERKSVGSQWGQKSVHSLMLIMKLIYITFACLVVMTICQTSDHGKHKGHGMNEVTTKGIERPRGRPQYIPINVWKIILAIFPQLKERHRAKIKAYTEYPPGRVIRKGKGYELRCYDKAKWATCSTTVQKPLKRSKRFLRILGAMMKKMGKYIKGNNADNVTIDMTSPVLHRFEKYDLRVTLPIPSNYQEDVPVPNDSSISIIELEMCVYVHDFRRPNFPDSQGVYEIEVRKLKTILMKAGLEGSYYNGVFYSATFDSIMKSNRRKEIWLLKKI